MKDQAAPPTIQNRDKLEKALGDLRKLPLFPATAQQAMALLLEDNVDRVAFTRLIERDVTLATSILKLANSPTYSWGRTIETLEQAVVRLGTRECQNLMLAVSMRNLYQEARPATKGVCAVLWKHCFLTACIARRLNRELRLDYKGEEFTAGLLHDLGRILFAVTMPDDFPDADPMDFMEDSSVLHREQDGLGENHCQFGADYAEQNRLPNAVVTAIRNHHRFEDAKDHRGLLALVVLADHLANYMQRTDRPNTCHLDENPGFKYLTRGWSAAKIAVLKQLTPKIVEETQMEADEQAAPARRSVKHSPAPKPAVPVIKEEDTGIWDKVRGWF